MVVWGARAAYVGPALNLKPHRNAAATVALALETPFCLTLSKADGPCAVVSSCELILPNTKHHLEASGAMAFVYLDAASAEVERFDRPHSLAALGEVWSFLPAAQLVEWLAEALGLSAVATTDGPLALVIRKIDANPMRFRTALDAAGAVGLSSSRFQHVFRDAVGVPFRRYRTWRRMAVVARCLAAGTNLTEAAYCAGFASAAHLSSTFRGLFGLTPSTLLEANARIECLSNAEAKVWG